MYELDEQELDQVSGGAVAAVVITEANAVGLSDLAKYGKASTTTHIKAGKNSFSLVNDSAATGNVTAVESQTFAAFTIG